MSWDASLVDDRGHTEREFNYTHNTSVMIYTVLTDSADWPWWARLSGMSGPEGAAFLDRIIRGLEADPELFRGMNPRNGWGDYDSLVAMLTTMRNAVPEWPTTWHASG